MTPEQKQQIKDWIATQPTRDTVRLSLELNAAQLGDWITPPPVVTPREAYDSELKVKAIAIEEVPPLSQYAGLSKKPLLDKLTENFNAAIAAAPTQEAKDAIRDAIAEMQSYNNLAIREGGGMGTADFGKPDSVYQPPDYQEPLPSVAVGILGRDIKPSEVEEIVGEMA